MTKPPMRWPAWACKRIGNVLAPAARFRGAAALTAELIDYLDRLDGSTARSAQALPTAPRTYRRRFELLGSVENTEEACCSR